MPPLWKPVPPWKRRSDPHALLVRFLDRYVGRTLLVHTGLEPAWIEELLKQAGGGGIFRVDLRQPPGRDPTPVEWLVHRHIAPLGLPCPLLVQVRQDGLRVRHLVQRGRPVHPGEILWVLDEIDTRHHALLRPAAGGLQVEWGIPAEDNRIEGPYGG